MDDIKNNAEKGAFVEQERGIHWAWIVLVTCFFNLFINYSVRLGYSVILPEMIRDLGFSRTGTGSIYNSYLIAYISLSPLTGYLTDRFGARRVIAVCALILGVGVILMGTVNRLGTACLYYGVVGLGASGMWTPIITVVQRWFAVQRRGLALGILSTGYGLGFAAIGALFPLIVAHYNWRYAWYFLGAGALVMVLVNSLLLRSDPEAVGLAPWGGQAAGKPVSPVDLPGSETVSMSRVIKERTFWIIGLSYLCTAYGLYGFTTFMVDYAQNQVGLPLERASFIATVHGISQVAGVLIILPLSDYLGRRKTIQLSNLVIVAAMVGVLLTGNSWVMLFAIIGVMGAFYGATWPMYSACSGDYFPMEVMGSVIGAWTPFYGLGAISAHWTYGMLRDTTGTYNLAFGIGTVAVAAGLILISIVKKGSRRH